MRTILTEAATFEVAAGPGLWLNAADAARVTGWHLRPEGMCRDDACVALPAAAVRPDSVDVAVFWERLGSPVVHDDSQSAWVLGASAQARLEALAGDTAPDFTLPDLDGKPHTLSRLRGNKVFLVTWASW